MAVNVTLRKNKISNGRLSLYLDFYPPVYDPKKNKQTRRETLKLYIYEKPKGVFEKTHNEEVLQIAEQIKLKRMVEYNKPEIYNEFEREQMKIKELGQINFVSYFKEIAKSRCSNPHDNWISAYNYLEKFTGGELKFEDLTERKMEDLKKFLLTTKSRRRKTARLSNNSAVSYFNKIKAGIKQAFIDGIIQVDLNARIKPIKPIESPREFLTIDELNKLIKTECNDPLYKRAALFSALTGLRFSDIQNLKWSDISTVSGKGNYINFVQKKTKGQERMPISDQALSLLNENDKTSGLVFDGLTYSAYHNRDLYQWLGAAGIAKKITFHCFRHTYAILQLESGTDIYTVSKMLGHRDLKTTQIYAKVLDKAKRETVDRIKLKFD
jgi:integrase